MAKEELRDANGQLLGYRQQNGVRIECWDATGHLKGYYDVRTDETRDQIGRLIGKGDLLTSLITDL